MNKYVAAFIIGAGLAVSSISTSIPAQAQEGTAVRNLFGSMGLLPNEKEEIDYRARAPLVVPPAMKLQEPAAPAASRNANWPKDPDVAARRAATKDSLLPATEREKYILGQRPLLSQEELQKGKINAAPITTPQRSSMDQSPYEVMIQPILIGRELAAQKNEKAETGAALGEEPKRRYLSDPPPGLRKPAGKGEYTRTKDAPAPLESRFGQQEFTASEGKR